MYKEDLLDLKKVAVKSYWSGRLRPNW
jgi:hypothetical protein